jgi:hypothetical protein
VQVSTVAILFVTVYHYFIKDFLHVGQPQCGSASAFIIGVGGR